MQNDHLIATLPSWGPTYKVSLDLYVNSFPSGQPSWAEILRFSTSDQNCCYPGDWSPLLMLDGESRLLVCGGTTSRGNWCRRLEISSNKWYKVELEQRIEPEEVIRKMKDLKKIAIKFYPF